MATPGAGRDRQQNQHSNTAHRSSRLDKFGYTPGKAINKLKPIPKSVQSKPLPKPEASQRTT